MNLNRTETVARYGKDSATNILEMMDKAIASLDNTKPLESMVALATMVGTAHSLLTLSVSVFEQFLSE